MTWNVDRNGKEEHRLNWMRENRFSVINFLYYNGIEQQWWHCSIERGTCTYYKNEKYGRQYAFEIENCALFNDERREKEKEEEIRPVTMEIHEFIHFFGLRNRYSIPGSMPFPKETQFFVRFLPVSIEYYVLLSRINISWIYRCRMSSFYMKQVNINKLKSLLRSSKIEIVIRCHPPCTIRSGDHIVCIVFKPF